MSKKPGQHHGINTLDAAAVSILADPNWAGNTFTTWNADDPIAPVKASVSAVVAFLNATQPHYAETHSGGERQRHLHAIEVNTILKGNWQNTRTASATPERERRPRRRVRACCPV